MKNWMITFLLRMKGTFSFMLKSSHINVYGYFSKLSTCKLTKCDIFIHICTLVFLLHFEFLCCMLKSIYVLVFHFT